MADRAVRAGETIRLRARFKDDLSDPAAAEDVFVSIYDPSQEDLANLDNALVALATPDYLGQGIYEYAYLVPDCGPDGTWHDVWIGDLTCQPLSGIFTFNVTASGVIEQLDDQIYSNNLIRVTLTSGIRPLDGGPGLEDEFVMEFLTTTVPSYSSVRYVNHQIGGFLGDLNDDTIQMAILEASIEADALVFATTLTNNKLFLHARRQYTTCVASRILLHNVGRQLLKSKTLGDLHVEFDTNGLNRMLQDTADCADKWQAQLMSGGGAKAATQPMMVVKGEFDPDRPVPSRSWIDAEFDCGSEKIPAANTRIRFSTSRRGNRTFRRRWW